MTNDTPDYDTASIFFGGTALIDKEVSFHVADADGWRRDPALMRAHLEEAVSYIRAFVEELVLQDEGGSYDVLLNVKVGRDVREFIRPTIE